MQAAKYTWRFTASALLPTLPAYLVRALVSAAAAAAAFSTLNGGVLPLDLIGMILSFAITMSCVALTLRLALNGELSGPIGLQLSADEFRLGLAHLIYIALIMFLGFIALVLVFIILTPVLAVLLPDTAAAADDPEAYRQIVEVFFTQTFSGVLLSVLFLVLVSLPLLYLTARLIAFPAATLQRQKIMLFETWGWTKGHVMPVIAAMLLALAPLWCVSMLGVWLGSQVTGIPMFPGNIAEAESVLTPMLGFVFGLITGVFSIPFTIASAGLAAFMYQGFNPDAERN
ncbi:MAG: hypothetical protein CMK09_12710 [Ponticaulis sp.]|nr:hypothetical protein [Ponticaulis sp.]